MQLIIEQTRYYALIESPLDDLRLARERVNEVRVALGLPAGITLIADPVPDEGPAIVWQCGYRSEVELARAESAIANSEEYGLASTVLRELASRVEIELYTSEHDEATGAEYND